MDLSSTVGYACPTFSKSENPESVDRGYYFTKRNKQHRVGGVIRKELNPDPIRRGNLKR